MDKFLYNIHTSSSWLQAFFAREQYLHTARFARPHELSEITSSALDGSHLLMAEGSFNRVYRVAPTKTKKELAHILIVGRSRGGKGLNIESNLLTWPHSVIVNDVKGELYQRTAGYRATFSKVFVIDPTGKGHKYDPLLGKHKESELQVAATNLLYSPKEEEKIFTDRAIVMLTQIFLAGRIEKEPLLPYARKMVRLGLIDIVKRLYVLNPELAIQFLDTDFTHADFQDKFLLSCWGTLSARMRKLLTDDTAKCFTGSDFTAKEIITSEKPVTIFLRWPERDLLALSTLVHLIWISLIDEMIFTYDTDTANCFPVLALLDEIGRTGLPNLPEYATTLAGRNISLLVAIQSLSQLDAIYGKNKADVLRDNMDTQIYYRPTSLHTAQYLEKRLGHKSGFAQSENSYSQTTSKGLSEREIPLLSAEEIMRMPDDEVIAFHRNLHPFRAKRLDWRRFQRLRERQVIPPPQLPILPALEERSTETETVRQNPLPLTSWRLDPALLRWGRPPINSNGIRK